MPDSDQRNFSGELKRSLAVGNNVTTTINVPFIDIILGTKLIVPTLDGKIELTIPPNTQSNKVFRLKGKGFRISTLKKGDQFVKLQVQLPAKLNSKQKSLLEAYKNL